MRAIDFIIEQQRKEAGRITPLQRGLILFNKKFPKKVIPKIKQPKVDIGKERQVQQSTGRTQVNPNVRGDEQVRVRDNVGGVQSVSQTEQIINPAAEKILPAAEKILPAAEKIAPVAPINWTERMKQWYDKDPVKTVALTGGGVYAGTKLLDNVFDKEGSAEIKVNKYAKKFIGK